MLYTQTTSWKNLTRRNVEATALTDSELFLCNDAWETSYTKGVEIYAPETGQTFTVLTDGRFFYLSDENGNVAASASNLKVIANKIKELMKEAATK